jgi:hypothetical protein
VLKLIRAFLNAAVMEDGLVRPAKTAFPRLPPVRRADLERQQGVDLTHSARPRPVFAHSGRPEST